jgi:hypothetical protein
MTKDEALKMALEQIELSPTRKSVHEVTQALRQALDQLPDTTKMIEPQAPDYKEIALDLLAHLTAATSLLERGGKKAAPSNAMFNIMLNDYKTSCERGREALREPDTDRGAWSDVEDATKWVDELRGDEPEAKPAFKFTRYVDGQEMAEGVVIEREETLEAAIKKAVSLCPKRPNTVLVYVPTPDAEPVARVTYDGDIIETGFGLLEGTLLYTAPPKREPIAWTARELEVLDEMIEKYLDYAARKFPPTNKHTARKQKELDMERVELLRKIRVLNNG